MKNSEGFTRAWAAAPVVGVSASVVVGSLLGIELGILVLAGVVLVGVIFVLWNSVHALTGESDLTLEEAMSLAAPSAEEEQKRSVLRTLKDLEYERSVGKISEEDYGELVSVYRTKAKELIEAVDNNTEQSREQAERLLAKRLAKNSEASKQQKRIASADSSSSTARPKAKKSSETDSETGTASKPDSQQHFVDEVEDADAPDSQEAPDGQAERDSVLDSDSGARTRCPECDTRNEPDARFCKHCGITLEAAS
jgi:vacuolar-type H+-ATPase subunit I/STV1